MIAIDLDPTCGAHELSLAAPFFDTAEFLPMVGCPTFHNKDEQYRVAAAPPPR